MTIEDLPIIREEEINEDTSRIVDRAEICYKWLPQPNEDFVHLTRLYFVLGRSEAGDVYVADQVAHYPDLGERINTLENSDQSYKKLSRIIDYTSLTLATGKTE